MHAIGHWALVAVDLLTLDCGHVSESCMRLGMQLLMQCEAEICWFRMLASMQLRRALCQIADALS